VVFASGTTNGEAHTAYRGDLRAVRGTFNANLQSSGLIILVHSVRGPWKSLLFLLCFFDQRHRTVSVFVPGVDINEH
jgi:hypothetical protein